MSLKFNNVLSNSPVVHSNENYYVTNQTSVDGDSLGFEIYRKGLGNGEDAWVSHHLDQFVAVGIADGANIAKMEKELLLMDEFEKEFGEEFGLELFDD